MEVIDLVRQRGRGLRLLIVIPLIAILVVGGVALAQPTQYQAQVTLVPPSLEDAASPAAVGQFMADFREALRSEGTVADVAEAAGISQGQVRSGISFRQLGSSRLIRVTFRGDDADEARAVPALAARRAMHFLNSSVEASAERSAAEAQQVFDEVLADIDDLRTRGNSPLPTEEYRTLASEIASLRVASQQARAGGQSTTADNLVEIIEEREDALDDLSSLVVQSQQLETRLSSADRDLALAAAALSDSQRVSEAIDAPELVRETTSTKLSPTADLVRSAATAGAAGLVVAIGLLWYQSRSVPGGLAGPASTSASTSASTRRPGREGRHLADDILDVDATDDADPPVFRDGPVPWDDLDSDEGTTSPDEAKRGADASAGPSATAAEASTSEPSLSDEDPFSPLDDLDDPLRAGSLSSRAERETFTFPWSDQEDLLVVSRRDDDGPAHAESTDR